jgi:hypothetical protein
MAASAQVWQLHRHLCADRIENVGASKSQNPMGLHGLLQGERYLLHMVIMISKHILGEEQDFFCWFVLVLFNEVASDTVVS